MRKSSELISQIEHKDTQLRTVIWTTLLLLIILFAVTIAYLFKFAAENKALLNDTKTAAENTQVIICLIDRKNPSRECEKVISKSLDLLDFTRQQNVLREPAVFHLDEPVEVEAVFLNKSPTNIVFNGVVHWLLVDPPLGISGAKKEIIDFTFVSTIEPGCKKYRFENHAPPEVEQVTRNLFRDGHDKVTWKIFGDNIIREPKNGGSIEFNVDEFSFIPNSKKLPDNKIQHDNTTCEIPNG